MTKSEIIDWLIQNDSLVREIIMSTNKQINDIPNEFKDDFIEQRFQQEKIKIYNEISTQNGLTSGSISEIISDEELRNFLYEFNCDPW